METISVEIPYELEMCVKGICTPLNIPISEDFRITSLEIDSSEVPLASACKIRVKFGNEIAYNGMIGSQGFTLSVVDIDENVGFNISLDTDCSLLVDLAENVEPIKVILKGEIKTQEKYGKGFTDEWA